MVFMVAASIPHDFFQTSDRFPLTPSNLFFVPSRTLFSIVLLFVLHTSLNWQAALEDTTASTQTSIWRKSSSLIWFWLNSGRYEVICWSPFSLLHEMHWFHWTWHGIPCSHALLAVALGSPALSLMQRQGMGRWTRKPPRFFGFPNLHFHLHRILVSSSHFRQYQPWLTMWRCRDGP
jgi:hypothetical protein